MFEAPTLAVARLVAEAHGFEDCDLEPMNVGQVRLTATKASGSVVRVNGTSVTDVAIKLIERLTNG